MRKVSLQQDESPKLIWSSIFDWRSLPRWETLAALTISVVIFSYFSVHIFTQPRGTSPNPFALVDGQETSDRWILRNELDKEDILQIALENGTAGKLFKE